MTEPRRKGRSPRAKTRRTTRSTSPRRVAAKPSLGGASRVARPARLSSSHAFVEFVLDQLGDRAVREKRMFGGSGLYHDEAFFGIVFRGRVYFKVSPEAREAYEARGMQPFQPSARQTLRSFWEVPPDVLEDPHELKQWARRAIAAAGD